MSDPVILPDGSAFSVLSLPLPKDHWLYAEREYEPGADEPNELPKPILNHAEHRDVVVAAIRYAVRGATMCGKEPDFDPDALVQNAVYALCGPYSRARSQDNDQWPDAGEGQNAQVQVLLRPVPVHHGRSDGNDQADKEEIQCCQNQRSAARWGATTAKCRCLLTEGLRALITALQTSWLRLMPPTCKRSQAAADTATNQ